jgi:hypothetical protein
MMDSIDDMYGIRTHEGFKFGGYKVDCHGRFSGRKAEACRRRSHRLGIQNNYIQNNYIQNNYIQIGSQQPFLKYMFGDCGILHVAPFGAIDGDSY